MEPFPKLTSKFAGPRKLLLSLRAIFRTGYLAWENAEDVGERFDNESLGGHVTFAAFKAELNGELLQPNDFNAALILENFARGGGREHSRGELAKIHVRKVVGALCGLVEAHDLPRVAVDFFAEREENEESKEVRIGKSRAAVQTPPGTVVPFTSFSRLLPPLLFLFAAMIFFHHVLSHFTSLTTLVSILPPFESQCLPGPPNGKCSFLEVLGVHTVVAYDAQT
ncbi:hypothetical protein B0H14DRAFT_3134957 [Mycena olivaceomarginata]|nr:hypothetical protein B0H14DRAFT_3134957 [Mycena olivaceomarginata]